MYIIFLILHIILCLSLIMIVLLQTGKGSELSSAFGGGGTSAMFGGRGPASFLNKMTTIAAVLFMATSISLAYLSSGRSSSVMNEYDEPVVEETTVPEGENLPVENSGNEDVDSSAKIPLTDQGESSASEEKAASHSSEPISDDKKPVEDAN